VLDWIGADHGAPVADGARRRYARRS
jgi:hypothetical protein